MKYRCFILLSLAYAGLNQIGRNKRLYEAVRCL